MFSSHGNDSPTKISVPTSRRQRNHASSRVHDIEFATEISTSLLAQVRQLQALLAEREEALKVLNLEKSRLELEAEGFSQRIRALDESEQRYKDENWSLETQTHELMAAIREAADRENRLNSNLSAMTSEKNTLQRELEDLKQANGRLIEEQAAAQKAHDAEAHLLRRNLNAGDAERLSLQQKVEELTSQNQELAKAVAMRFRQLEAEPPRDASPDTEGDLPDQETPENSPPTSPNKPTPTPRHGHLETETLKSSLGHAHRMIQNLKSIIHREKTEKIELKRMLQDARDELEQRRRDPPGAAITTGIKRQKTKAAAVAAAVEAFKKPPRPEMLGAVRRGKTEIEFDEPDWEDHTSEASPTRPPASRSGSSIAPESSAEQTEQSDVYQTATEGDIYQTATEDAFETANERETTTESETTFHTGVESMDDDSTDELTETEDRGRRQGTLRGRMPSSLSLAKAGERNSFESTASTSADEYEEEVQAPPTPKTPVQSQPQRYRLKMNRGALRRTRGDEFESEPPSVQDSPASSFRRDSAAVPQGQSLFAELGGFGSPGNEADFGTPARSDTVSQTSTPRMFPISDPRRMSEATVASMPPVASRPLMVDSGMMTDPWEPSVQAAANLNDGPATPTAPRTPESRPTNEALPAVENKGLPKLVNSSTQWTPLRSPAGPNGEQLSTVPTPPKMIWDESAPEVESEASAEQASEQAVPEPPRLEVSEILSEETAPVAPTAAELTMSSILTETTEPVPPKLPEPEPETPPVLPELTVSSIQSEQTEPVSPDVPVQSVPQLSFSTIHSTETLPVEPARAAIVRNTVSIGTQADAPEKEKEPPVVVAEDKTSQDSSTSTDDHEEGVSMPLGVISGNVAPRDAKTRSSNTDHGAQTILSSKQIDQILMDRDAARSLSQSDLNASAVPVTPRAKSNESMMTAFRPAQRRPGSANSQKSNATSHPPLPADHKQAIAAAQAMPVENAQNAQSSSGVMGPPLAPASAYKNAQTRPRTPNEHGSQTGSGSVKNTTGSTARARRRGSQISRRSSVSSFASELDERFNMHTDAQTQDSGSGTDPRMIQAITQTMIGEFLWKYTRKTVSGEMSNTRHRRYFWVHPYTRTLYWSEQDPQTAGKTELKAKSVAIEAVRVVTDDNPYPPGLHRKSLEVITPGRRVKFTAATSQRHETWYNALSYLLLRSSGEDPEDQENQITTDDINEFNPGYRTASHQTTSRMSFSSYNSRTARNNQNKQRAGSAMSVRPAATPGRASPALSAPPHATLRATDQARHSSASRLSAVFNTTIRSSFSGRRGRHGHAEEIYDTTAADHDSAEDLRHIIERQEREADRLENVRACCDGKQRSPFALITRWLNNESGKHDVSSLSRTSRYSPRLNRHSHSYN